MARTGEGDRAVIPHAVQTSSPTSSARLTCREVRLGLLSGPSNVSRSSTVTEARRMPTAAGFGFWTMHHVALGFLSVCQHLKKREGAAGWAAPSAYAALS